MPAFLPPRPRPPKKQKLYKALMSEESTKDADSEVINALIEESGHEDVVSLLKSLKHQFELVMEQNDAKENEKDFAVSPEIPGRSENSKMISDVLMHFELKKIGNQWFIPSSKINHDELKYLCRKIENILNDTLLSNTKFSTICRKCDKEFKSLLQHLNKKSDCKEKYSSSDMDELRKVASLKDKLWHKEDYKEKKDYYAEQYQNMKKDIANKYQLNKEKVALRNSNYYKEHRKEIKTRNLKNYAKSKSNTTPKPSTSTTKASPSSTKNMKNKEELSDYEKIREDNIAEMKEKLKNFKQC